MDIAGSVRVGSGWIYVVAISGCVGLVVAMLAQDGSREAQLATLTAGTARFAFPVFVLAFTASAWRALFPSPFTRWLVRERRHLGLAFALIHFLHFGALVALNVERGEVPGAVTLIGGGLAYAFVLAMALTSNAAAQRWLRGRWRTLHLVGGWYVWVIFTQSYAGRVVAGAEPFAMYVLLTLLAVLVPVVRWRAGRATGVRAVSTREA